MSQLPPGMSSRTYNNQSPASPVHLSASVIVKSGSSGAVDDTLLKNPMGQDMEILEIKWELSAPLPDASSQTIMGGTIWCELTMGAVKLTNGAIPVWNFARSENLAGQYKVGATNGYEVYTWRLPRPLYVPAGAVVSANFVHTAFITSPVNVRINYSGRTITKRPKQICVPWVAKYASKAFNPISAAAVDNSTALDLVNPNPEPLKLQRFIGRTLWVPNAGGGSSENLPQSFGSQYLLTRITDSYGRPIVRLFTPFRVVFSALTRSWEMDNGTELDPQAYYLVNMKKAAMTMATDGIAQAFISIVGWRELGSAS